MGAVDRRWNGISGVERKFVRLLVYTALDTFNEKFFERYCAFHSKYADKIMVAVDCFEKEDLSPETYEIGKKYNVEMFKLDFKFHEGKMHTECFKRCKKYNPEWVANIDSDELLDEAIFNRIDNMLADKNCFWYSFHVYHLWGDETHYRADGMFLSGTQMYIVLFYRYVDNYIYCDKDWHGERYPNDILNKPGKKIDDIRIKHLAYIDHEAFKRKIILRAPHYGNVNQNYGTPVLKEWIELK